MTDEEVAALLAGGPFASASALLIATGSPLRAVFATPAMLEMFGANDLRALDAVAFRSESPGARRFRQLAQSLSAGAPARLERLRFFRSGHPLPLGLICARVASADGEEFLVAGSPARSAEEAPEAPIASPPEPTRIAPPRRLLRPMDPRAFSGRSTPTIISGRPISRFPRGSGRTRRSPEKPARRGSPGFVSIPATRLPRRSPRAARSRPSASNGRISSGARALVVLISGAAVFDRDRNFGGFRGFGVFTGEDAPFAAAPLAAPETATFEPPPRGGRDGGAEIVVLRPGAALPRARRTSCRCGRTPSAFRPRRTRTPNRATRPTA